MGVTGLWRLIDPAGKPVPVETLENKVLAVDISIWLHQVVKGYQDAKGAPLPNAHLMGLFQRLCKLLYFRIKPIFVFDGGFPDLKKEIIARRQDSKAKYNSESERLKREIVLLLSKKTAIGSILCKNVSPKKAQKEVIQAKENDDLFKLPELPQMEDESSESESEEQNSSASSIDLHSVDMESSNFKNLPIKEKYDLLIELKETRKMNSWGRLHDLPKQSDNFSDFQMSRLLKRRKVQECLEATEKEMGGNSLSLNELESLLNEEGIDTKIDDLPSNRIASSDTTRFLLINDMKLARENAKKAETTQTTIEKIILEENIASTSSQDNSKRDELDEDLKKAIQMSLECIDDSEPDVDNSKIQSSPVSTFMFDSEDLDIVEEVEEEEAGEENASKKDFSQPTMSCAKAFIMENTDFTNKTINEIIGLSKNKCKSKVSNDRLKEILNDLQKEKERIVACIDLSSGNDVTNLENNINNDIQTDNITFNELEGPSCITGIQKVDRANIMLDFTADDEQLKESERLENDLPTSSDIFDVISSDDDDDSKVNKITNNSIETRCSISNTHLDDSQIMIIENSTNEVISLDSSVDEELDNEKSRCISSKNNIDNNYEESSSEDDDFEEVTDRDKIEGKIAVQITFDPNKQPEDDIFADVFTTIQEESSDVKEIHKDKDLEEVKVINEENILKSQNKLKVAENCTKTLISAYKKSKEVSSCSVETENLTVTKKSINVEIPKQVNNNLLEPPKELKDKLSCIAEDIEKEKDGLLQEKAKLDRMGRNITEQMTKEVQELLQIFGIPYVVAPMEAEAQCAYLESIKLTDGTITDDSDIWLFGGNTVYKNFFNQKKHVLQFLAERIEKSFSLSREKLILLALLVGSDYTMGVNGVGPVTALEILASFPFDRNNSRPNMSKQAHYDFILDGLKKFKQWVRSGKRTDDNILKKKLKNVDVTDDFPSVRVVQAYLEPNVERSEENFTWGEPDITILRDYTKNKFGWSQTKLDEIMNPVLKRMLDKKSQKTVDQFFKRKIEFHSLEDQMSKRVKAAVIKMDPNAIQNKEVTVKEKSKNPRKRKSKQEKKTKANAEIKLIDAIHTEKKITTLPEVQNIESGGIEIKVPKLDRYQEIIPQREKDRQSVLKNKLKAIELYRKNKLGKKSKTVKRKVNLPLEKAKLSESSDSD